MSATPERILAAVVNWNGWRDTLTCVDSMRGIAAPAFDLLICDNGSSDGSCSHLQEWARRALGPCTESRSDLGSQGCVVSYHAAHPLEGMGVVKSVHVMRLEGNAGYAGAINRCIEWGQKALSPTAFWLLNNDVRVEPEALSHLVACARSGPASGLCGSLLLEWTDPERIQAIGGIFRWSLGVGGHLTRLPPSVSSEQRVFTDVDYPVGASLFVTNEFVQKVGLMDDSYFLYFEEMDWVERGRRHGFRPAVALHSKVRHKQGASTGSSGGVRDLSMLSEYYSVVNRLRFTRKFAPWRLPIVWLSLALVVADRLLHSEWQRAGLVLRLMLWPGSVPRPGAAPGDNGA